MQILCNGLYLDIIEGATIALSKSNPIFAFDDLTAERSIAFDIPETSKNNRVFGFAGVPNVSPQSPDFRYDAQLQADGVVKDGWLHLVGYDPKKRVYKAVFVLGDMLVLKRAKNAGKLKSFLNLPWSTIYAETPTHYVDAPYTIGEYYRGELYNNKSEYFPSINFASLFQAACSYFGITCGDVRTSTEFGYYLLPSELKNRAGNDATLGEEVYAQDNLPDLTFIDLVKMWGILSGKLPYMDGNTLIYSDFSGSSWEILRSISDRVIEIKELKRSFGNYAENNFIDVENSVDGGGTPSISYGQTGASAEGSKRLYDFPLKGCGRKAYSNLYYNVYSAIVADDYCICKKIAYNESGVYNFVGTLLQKLSVTITQGQTRPIFYDSNNLPKNQFLQGLLVDPVSITARVRMSMLEYEQIGARTIFLIDGVKYVWTKAEYNKNVVTLQLSRR